MVAVVLIVALLLAPLPGWGGAPRQMCLACHPVHHAERGCCIVCHRGNPASERKNIAHARLIPGRYAYFAMADRPQLANGRQLFDRYGCRRCHVSDGRGNRLAVDLDRVASRKGPVDLARSIRKPVVGMPDFGVDDEQATALVTAILAGSMAHRGEAEAPVTVHFTAAGSRNSDVFTRRCGPCHRMLSDSRGGVGTGAIGPNLSGLFSPYYPKTFRGSEAWTAQGLGSWLKNPRAIRPWARMRPVPLTVAEMRELEAIMQPTPERKQ